MSEVVVLVGMMGTGKSAVARAVALRRGWAEIDTDTLVEEATGKSVAALFEERGEEAFRDLETRALATSLDSPGPVVIATGGGAILKRENRQRILSKSTGVVWLRAEPSTLARRVGKGKGRPLLHGTHESIAARLAEIAEDRRPAYEEVATLVVDVDDLTVREIADVILSSCSGAR